MLLNFIYNMTLNNLFHVVPQKLLTLNFTLRIPGSENLKDSRYTTCMDIVKSETRFVANNFKHMKSIAAHGLSCPQLSTNEDHVEPNPSLKDFFCPSGLKLKKQKNNNLCCKCCVHIHCKTIEWSH